MGVRRAGRELALQALYQRDVIGDGEGPAAAFWEGATGEPEAMSFARELVAGVGAHAERIDVLIGQAVQHWRLGRLSRVDRCVLRLATFELLERAEIPVSVTIDEAIEIARRYGSDDSPAFVNGVLDRIARLAGEALPEKDEA
jgi:N utilization substance protein B